MTEPSRSSPEVQATDVVSSGQLDPTRAHPGGEVALSPFRKPAPESEPEFGPPEKPGEAGTIGRYRVLKKLGQGGMGAVYLGFDGKLGRRVALKVMLPAHAADPESRARFIREARAAAAVNSDHVVTIYDVGEERGVAFIAMEYLLGYPLDQYLRVTGELPLAQAVRVATETALGLAAAHDLKLVHRDIKPGNVWLEAPHGRVKILDFGLARAQNDETHLTTSGLVVGTPAFMSPEQARGQKLDGRSDLFSLGVMLYRLATGKMPFDGSTTMALLTSLAVDAPAPARNVPPALEAVIKKLLAKRPDDRYQTAWEVVAALRGAEQPRLVTGELPRAVPAAAVPMAIAAQSDNVWEGIEESVSSPRLVESGTAVGSAPVVRTERTRPRQKGSKWPLVLALAALLTAVGALAPVLLRAPQGKLVVDSDDPDAELVIKKGGAVVRDRTRERELALRGGVGYTAELADPKPGLRLTPRQFDITPDGTTHLRVTVEPPPPPPPPVAPERRAAEYVLSLGGTVRINGEPQDVADLPKGAFTLTRVNLSNKAGLTDAGLAVLAKCKGPLALYIDRTPVTDAGLAHFKGCTTVTVLDLGGTKVTDAGLANFADCTALTELSLHEVAVGDLGMAHFKGCKALTYLRLSGTRVTDLGLVYFKGCTELTSLVLGYTTVVGLGLGSFSDCPNLKHLDLGNTPGGDIGLSNFKGCKKLTILTLAGRSVTDAGFANFAGNKGLEMLHLDRTKVTDKTLDVLTEFKNLGYLDVSLSPVTEPKVRALADILPRSRVKWTRGIFEPKG